MKRVGDIKTSSRPYWVAENPDTLCINRGDFLQSSWDEAIDTVNGQQKPIVIMSGPGRDMPGAVVPAEYLYAFHYTFPHLSDLSPIHHVTPEELKAHFDDLSNMLYEGHNIVVVNDEGHPIFGVANWGTALDFEIQPDGTMALRDEFSQHMFSGEVYVYEPDPEDHKKFIELFGDWEPPPPPEMSERDARIVKEMVECLSGVGSGRERYAEAVRDAVIDLG